MFNLTASCKLQSLSCNISCNGQMSICLLIIMLDTNQIMPIFQIVHFVNITVGTFPQVYKYYRPFNNENILLHKTSKTPFLCWQTSTCFGCQLLSQNTVKVSKNTSSMTSEHGADNKHLLTGPMMVACQWNTAENRKQKLGKGGTFAVEPLLLSSQPLCL